MDIRKIKKMIELLEESGIAEIEIKEGEETLRIARAPPASAADVCHGSPSSGDRRRAGTLASGAADGCGRSGAGHPASRRAHRHRADGRDLLLRALARREELHRDRRRSRTRPGPVHHRGHEDDESDRGGKGRHRRRRSWSRTASRSSSVSRCSSSNSPSQCLRKSLSPIVAKSRCAFCAPAASSASRPWRCIRPPTPA